MEVCTDLQEILNKTENRESFALYFSDGVCSVAESIYPKLEDLFKSDFSQIDLYSVIGPMSPEIQGHFQVFTAPCLLICIDGKETIRKAGSFSVVKLQEEIERVYRLRFS